MDAHQIAHTSAPLPNMPYTLNMGQTPNRALTFNRKLERNNKPESDPQSVTLGGRVNTSSVVVFPTLRQALQFRDEFVTCSNMQHREWSTNPRDEPENNPFAVSYSTGIKFTGRNHHMGEINPIPFEFEKPEYLDKLITYNVSIFMFDAYLYNPVKRKLTVFGNIWTPPEHIMYYPSDIDALYKQ